MNTYIITFDSGAPTYKSNERRVIKADSPADAVMQLMQTIRVNCIVKIKRSYMNINIRK